MFSPGTVKALGLIAKGVSEDKAFALGNQIDLEKAAYRNAVYGTRASQAAASSVGTQPAPTNYTSFTALPDLTNVIKGEKQPDSFASSLMQPVTPDSDSPFISNMKDWSGTSNLLPPSKVKTSYDPAPPPSEPTLEEYLKMTAPEAIFKPTTQGENSSEAIAKRLFNLDLSPSIDFGDSVERLGVVTDKGIGYNKMSQDLLASPSSQDLDKNYGNIQAELTEKETFLQGKKDSIERTLLEPGNDSLYNEKWEVDNKLQNLKGLKQDLTKYYNKKQLEFKSTNSIDALLQAAVASPDSKKFLEDIVKSSKNKALGFYSDVTGEDATSLVKETNVDIFYKNPFKTGTFDPRTENRTAMEGIDLLNQDLSKVSEATAQDVIYNNAKAGLINTHVALGQDYQRILTQRTLDTVKDIEKLNLKVKNVKLNEEQYDEYKTQFDALQDKLNLLENASNAVSEIYNPEKIKENKQLYGYAKKYLDTQQATDRASKLYSGIEVADATGTEKARYQDWFGKHFYRTGGKFFSEVAKIGESFVALGANIAGIESYEKYSRAFREKVSPLDLVDFRKIADDGNPISVDEIYYSKKDGFLGLGFNYAGLLYTAAQTAPLVIGGATAGTGFTSLAGKGVQAISKGGRFIPSALTKRALTSHSVSKFSAAYAKTGNYGIAYQQALSTSSKPWVKALGTNVPNTLGFASLIYPTTFADTYHDMRARGVENAGAKAHAVAAVTAAIESVTESIFPEIQYLDDFAEKGVLKKPKFGTKSRQYETLYGDVFGEVLSNNTLNYLTSKSLRAIGDVGAGARFLVARGVPEGIEEVGSEVLNFVADSAGMASVKEQEVQPLDFKGLASAFTGGLVGPPIGIGRQIKAYRKNQTTQQMFEIMLNSQYYKSKINEGLKNKEIEPDQAAKVIAKIEELEAVEKTFGVRNLRSLEKTGVGDLTITDLLEDPVKQFDYFSTILEVQDIEGKLATIGEGKLEEKKRDELLARAEEAQSRIDDYKVKSDFYTNLKVEDKEAILAKTVNTKVKLSRVASNDVIDKNAAAAEDIVARAIAEKRPEYYIEQLRKYRDSLAATKAERELAEQTARDNGTYNPLTDAIDNEVPVADLTGVDTAEELELLIAQALLSPNRGSDLMMLLQNEFDRQIEGLDKDSAALVEEYLNALNGGPSLEQGEVRTNAEGDAVETEGQVTNRKYRTVADLSGEQKAELDGLLEELQQNQQDLIKRRNTVAEAFDSVVNASIASGQISFEEQENFLKNASTRYAILMEMLHSEGLEYSQDVFYNHLELANFIAANKDAYDKIADRIKKQEEEAAKEGETEQEVREEVPLDETKPEITIPGLTPEDITPEFEAAIEELEATPAQFTVQESNNSSEEVLTEQEYNQRRGDLLKVLFNEVFNSNTINAAKAKMAAIMQAAGESNEAVMDTLALMDKAFKGEPIADAEKTHMFKLLDLQSDFSTDYAEAPVEEDPRAEIEKRRQAELEKNVQDLEDRRTALRGEDGVVPEENMAEWKQLNTDIIEAKAKATRADTSKTGRIFIRTKPKSLEEDPTVLTGKDAQLAEIIIEKIISKGIAEGLSTDKIIQKVISKYSFSLPDQNSLNNYISDRNSDAPEIGNNKQSFPAWRKGEYDAKPAALPQAPVVETVPEPTPQPPVEVEGAQLTLELPPVETPPAPPATPEQQAEVESKNNIAFTSPLFFPNSVKGQANLPFFKIQEKILNGVFANRTKYKPAVVDLFTVIEDVLGKEVLDRWEAIYNELQSPELTGERRGELRNEFLNLFPLGFMKSDALTYIFDMQMGKTKLSNRPDQALASKIKYSLQEIGPLNHTRNVTVSRPGMPGQLKGRFIYTNGVAKLVQGEGANAVWTVLDINKDKILGLQYPIYGDPSEFTFNDLNTLTMSTINADGKVQKYNQSGLPAGAGKYAMISYLPTSKTKGTATPQQQQFDDLRIAVAKGTRVKKEVAVDKDISKEGKVRVETTDASGNIIYVDQDEKLTVEYNTEGLFPVASNTSPTPAQVDKQKAELAAGKKGQSETVVETNAEKIERLRAEEQAALLKAIPRLEKYRVNGEIDKSLMSPTARKKYERISNKYNKLITPLLAEESVVSEPTVQESTPTTKPFDVTLIQENNPNFSSSSIETAADVLSSQGLDIESLLGLRGLDDSINDPDITNPKDCG